MIGKINYEDGRTYICDDCRKNVCKFKSHKAAIAAGWAISRDYTKCYCPDCAPYHRHVGRAGAKLSPQPVNTGVPFKDNNDTYQQKGCSKH